METSATFCWSRSSNGCGCSGTVAWHDVHNDLQLTSPLVTTDQDHRSRRVDVLGPKWLRQMLCDVSSSICCKAKGSSLQVNNRGAQIMDPISSGGLSSRLDVAEGRTKNRLACRTGELSHVKGIILPTLTPRWCSCIASQEMTTSEEEHIPTARCLRRMEVTNFRKRQREAGVRISNRSSPMPGMSNHGPSPRSPPVSEGLSIHQMRLKLPELPSLGL